MRIVSTLLIAAAIFGPMTLPAAAKCAMIRGTGIGVTDGIARWMANKAVVDSATKWANGGRHSLTPVKISCSGLSCSGAAKACSK
jgi:hypothetical protein